MMTGEKYVWRARTPNRRKTSTGLRGNRMFAVAMGALAALTGVFGAAQVAAAAPAVSYPNAISNISLEKAAGGGPLNQWQEVRISGDWAVPEGARAGETFGMTLPEEFSRKGAPEFSITDPDSDAVMATCVVASGNGPELVCTLAAAVEGLENVGGSFWMQAQASQSTSNETVTFDLGGNELEIVDLPGEGGIIPENLTEAEKPYKYGGATETDGRLRWVVGVPSGYVTNGSFTIKDSLDPSHESHRYTGEIRLMQRPVVDGTLTGDWTQVPADSYTATFAEGNQSFEFTATGLPNEGFSYRLIYFTDADDDIVLEGDIFGNRAIVNTTETSATHTVATSGGGSGSGVQYTRFSITKALTGAQAAAASGATYTVQYSIKGSDAPATTLSVPVGESVRSERAPLGSTFVIEEIDLPVIEGVVWGAWTITGEGVIAAGDGTYEVTPGTTAGVELTLTNTANEVPVEPTPEPKPSPEPKPKPTTSTAPGELALTGGTANPALLTIAVALIAGGAIAGGVAVRKRATRR
jgi:hypothetical protein